MERCNRRVIIGVIPSPDQEAALAFPLRRAAVDAPHHVYAPVFQQQRIERRIKRNRKRSHLAAREDIAKPRRVADLQKRRCLEEEVSAGVGNTDMCICGYGIPLIFVL